MTLFPTSLMTLSFLVIYIGNCDAFTNPIFHSKPAVKELRIKDLTKNFAIEKNEEDAAPCLARRSFFDTCAMSSFFVIAANVNTANASGGATAGGAYLLSAKQRYNERVIEGVQQFISLESSLSKGSVAEAAVFFDGNGKGTWKDTKAAGYLLANAFRRSSSTAPDKLPSVKAWKKFAAGVEAIQKPVSKKKAKPSLEAFLKAKEFLEPYLEEVDLTSALEK